MTLRRLRFLSGFFSLAFLASLGLQTHSLAVAPSPVRKTPVKTSPVKPSSAKAPVSSRVAPQVSPAQKLQAIVDKANAYAAKENYLSAIPLYEQALQLAPDEKIFRNNLAVLYYNQGVSFQSNHDYNQALTCFEKSLALVPNQPEVIRAKAANFYDEALTLREAESTDLAQIKTLLEKAIAVDPETVAFQKALASVYLGEARDLSLQEAYLPALEALKKARQLDPNGHAIRQSMANVYLALASQLASAEETPAIRDQQKAYVDEALALENSPAVQQRAKSILAGQISYGGSSSGGLDGSGTPSGGMMTPRMTSGKSQKPALYQSNDSLQDQLTAVEEALALEPLEAAMPERLLRCEKQVYGKAQKGSLQERVQQLYAGLLGSGQTARQSVPNLVQAAIQTTEGTYLDQVFQFTDGRIVRWARFPVKVYLEVPEKQPLYKKEFEKALLDGFDLWKKATNGFVSYIQVKNALAADIEVVWADEYVDRFQDPKIVADNPLKNFSPPKTSRLAQAAGIASMFTPGVFGLAPQALAAGLQYRQNQKLQFLEDESKITMGLKGVQGLSNEQALVLIQNMAAYEFGHALGIKGISDDPTDLMYPTLTADGVRKPSARDLKTLREIYSRPANIVLNIH